jgi:hypothetical protein
MLMFAHKYCTISNRLPFLGRPASMIPGGNEMTRAASLFCIALLFGFWELACCKTFVEGEFVATARKSQYHSVCWLLHTAHVYMRRPSPQEHLNNSGLTSLCTEALLFSSTMLPKSLKLIFPTHTFCTIVT